MKKNKISLKEYLPVFILSFVSIVVLTILFTSNFFIKPSAVEDSYATMYTTAALNVRTGPSTNYKKIDVLKKGTKVIIYETIDNWCKIEYKDSSAYVCKTYLSSNEPKPKNVETKKEEKVEKLTISENSMEYEILKLLNEHRASLGLQELKMNQNLINAAQIRAQEASINWSHTRPNGQDPSSVFKACNATYTGVNAAEDLGKNFASANELVEAWLNSPSHCASIENGNLLKAGLYIFTDANGVNYIALMMTD